MLESLGLSGACAVAGGLHGDTFISAPEMAEADAWRR